VIRFQCTCGRWLNVDDDLAGRRVACSKCGAQSQAPAAAPLSAPEALAAAMREATQTPEEDLPTATIVEEPQEAAPPTDGLEALAHAVKSAPAPKLGPRGPQPVARGRRPAGPAARSPLQAGRKGAPAAQRMSPTLIGVIGGAAAFLLLIVILALFGGGGEPPKKETPSPNPPPPVVEAPKPKRYTGHQPGEMFRQVPFDEEKQDPQGQPPAKKP